MSKGIYVGVNTEFPIYETVTTTVPFNMDTFDTFFWSDSDSSTKHDVDDTLNNIKYVMITAPNTNSSTGNSIYFTETLTVLRPIENVEIEFDDQYEVGGSYLKINGTTIGYQESVTWTGNLAVGDTISMHGYTFRDSYGPVYFRFYIPDVTTTETVVSGYESKLVARKVKRGYVPVMTDVPIYEETTTTDTYALNVSNIDKFFSVVNGSSTSGWAYSDNANGLLLKPNNFGVDSSTATIAMTAVCTIKNLKITYQYYTESGYDKLTLTVGSTTVLSDASGTKTSTTWSSTTDIVAGQTIVFKYVKDSSQSVSDESSTQFVLTCDAISATVTTKEVVGHTTMMAARKIKKGYVGVDGIARLFYQSSGGLSSFNYTGDYTVESVEVDGCDCNLYTLTSSGLLSIEGEAQYWMCGGGGGGESGDASNVGVGVGGGGGYCQSGMINTGAYTITIGAGGFPDSNGSETSFTGTDSANTISAAGGSGSNGSGGSGGGGAPSWLTVGTVGLTPPGSGDGMTKIPFDNSAIFQNPYCPGGGGGGMRHSSDYGKGGDGGSNGSDGLPAAKSGTASAGGSGGSEGGGKGGNGASTGYIASDASAYGGGGGGGGYYYPGSDAKAGSGGFGYQGVMFILAPV